jgi:hypothetical protein
MRLVARPLVVLVVFGLVWAVLFFAATATAQIRIDTARMTVGTRGVVTVRFTEALSNVRVSLNGRITVSNPTVFFPERVRAPFTSSELEHSIVQRTDSTFDFSLIFQRAAQSRDTLCLLEGEALAGSDSLCVVRLSGLSLTLGSSIRTPATTSGTIISRTLGAPLIYVRVAKLEPSVPNPAPRNQMMSWTYRIDKDSDVSLKLYNLLGQEVLTLPQGFQNKGTHTIRFVPSNLDFGVGRYWARLVTNSGEDIQSFHIGEW